MSILKELKEGWDKLDKDEYWTSNSHSFSIFLLGLGLVSLSILYIPIEIYYHLKYR